eukprot:433763_1
MAALLSMFTIFIIGNSQMPSIPLQNAADKDLRMPVVGLGTFSYYPYGSNLSENWNYSVAFDASLSWFALNGTRWDSAYSYGSKKGIADGLNYVTNNYTTVPRSNIFITQKVGEAAMGYDNVTQQFEELLHMFHTTYFDLVLIHWPTDDGAHYKNKSSSTDPSCQPQNPTTYNASICRQNTWSALVDWYRNGTAKAIGVSNWEEKHIMDIMNMNSLLPAVNQFEFHGYWHEFLLVEFCNNYNITVNSYAPLGVPDVEAYQFNNWTYIMPQEPTAIKIGGKYGKSAAQVWLKWEWQQGIVLNPRTLNKTHMKQNMNIFDFQLTEGEMKQLSAVNATAPIYPKNKVCPDPSTYS